MIVRFVAFLILATLCGPAFADEPPRKIDFARTLIGPDGPFKDCRKMDEAGKCLEQTDLTLGRLCLAAAAMPEKGVNPADQVARGKLAMELLDVISRQGPKEMALSADDIKFLKDQIAKLGYSTMAVYQAVKLLDPAADK